MRRAETEEELERYSRALTIDGMLSARGGTRAIRLLSAHQLLLTALIAARHVLDLLLYNKESTLAELIVGDARKRTTTHVEHWWICRRTLRWPAPLRHKFLVVLAMTPRVPQALPPFDSCRTCIRGTPQVRRTWLYVDLDDSFRCRFDDD